MEICFPFLQNANCLIKINFSPPSSRLPVAVPVAIDFDFLSPLPSRK